jgi:large subunit ribosomal protein L25
MELVAEERKQLGKTTKKLKTEGKMPAVLYGASTESLPLTLSLMDYTKVYKQAGETDLIDLKVGTEKHKVLIKNSQFDPISGRIIHAELFAPNLKEKTEAEIPVEVINEEANPLVKSGEGVVLTLINEITVRALPADLPHEFTIDASKFAAIGDGITVAQLEYDKEKVELIDVEPEDIVVKLDKVENAEEEVTVAEAEAEALSKLEATAEKKPEEGEEDAKEVKGKGKEPTKEPAKDTKEKK